MTVDRRRFIRDSSLLVAAGALGGGRLLASGLASNADAGTAGSRRDVELLASYWTISGAAIPATGREYRSFDCRDRVEASTRVGFKGMGIWHADLYTTRETRSLAEHGAHWNDISARYRSFFAMLERREIQNSSRTRLQYLANSGNGFRGSLFVLEASTVLDQLMTELFAGETLAGAGASRARG